MSEKYISPEHAIRQLLEFKIKFPKIPEIPIRPKPEPEVKPEIEPEVKPEVKPEIEPEVKPEIEPEVKPEVKPETPNIKVDNPTIKTDIDTQLKTDIDTKLKTDIDTKFKNAPNTKFKAPNTPNTKVQAPGFLMGLGGLTPGQSIGVGNIGTFNVPSHVHMANDRRVFEEMKNKLLEISLKERYSGERAVTPATVVKSANTPVANTVKPDQRDLNDRSNDVKRVVNTPAPVANTVKPDQRDLNDRSNDVKRVVNTPIVNSEKPYTVDKIVDLFKPKSDAQGLDPLKLANPKPPASSMSGSGIMSPGNRPPMVSSISGSGIMSPGNKPQMGSSAAPSDGNPPPSNMTPRAQSPRVGTDNNMAPKTGMNTKIKIEKGDTLTSIAKKQGTTVDQLMRKNKQITDPNKIYAGQDITVEETKDASEARKEIVNVPRPNSKREKTMTRNQEIKQKIVEENRINKKIIKDSIKNYSVKINPELKNTNINERIGIAGRISNAVTAAAPKILGIGAGGVVGAEGGLDPVKKVTDKYAPRDDPAQDKALKGQTDFLGVKNDAYSGVDTVLDAASIYPGWGTIPALYSAKRSYDRGENLDAFLNLVSAVPFVGTAIKGVKMLSKAGKAIEKVGTVASDLASGAQLGNISHEVDEISKTNKIPKSEVWDKVPGILGNQVVDDVVNPVVSKIKDFVNPVVSKIKNSTK